MVENDFVGTSTLQHILNPELLSATSPFLLARIAEPRLPDGPPMLVDLRRCWNIGVTFLLFALPFLLGLYESAFRGVAGEESQRFLAPSLVSAGLGLLLPCLSIGPKPPPGRTTGSSPDARARRDYNWNAAVLIIAVMLGLVGSLLWTASLEYSMKGTFPLWWPEWGFGGWLGSRLGVAGTEVVAYYLLTIVAALAKLARPA
ncbi:hypothetical protein F6X40_27495 [Paraburkholderia sp. UCT31]|uniref:hypothetical protein n=1 Tax=Paraburkholderia sp. UCT31 TaxID=2615209 RepID=UPI0016566C04|nr:hypothetical protein [Paraburkholderia sp. UCT31]MBC8740406.1 hypothetical protein [Paraburkholderia sp. UCT31]